jgi:hypothetical protein
MTSLLGIYVLFILLTIPIIVIRSKHRRGLPLERLEKVAIYLDIFGVVVYIILTAIDQLLPFAGLPLTIPSELIWGVLIVLIASVIITVALRFKQRSYVERIKGIMAYVFFPINTLEQDKNLDYHKQHFHKKILVSFRKNPPQAYYLHAANTSYGWRLIKKYPDLWTSVEDSIYPKPDTIEWCQKQGYELHPWSATKTELRESMADLNPDLMAKLKELKLEGKLDDFRIVFLCPWYNFHSCKEYPNRRILQKHSTKEAYDAPDHSIELIHNEILTYTTKVKWFWQTVKCWSKRNGGYTYMDWSYSEKRLAEKT